MEQRIKGSVSSKLYGFESLLSPLIAKACIEVCPKNTANFNVDNVRVVKIPGSGAHNSQLVRGVVIKREPEGSVRSVKKAKVAVFAQGVDTAATETKASIPGCSTAAQAWSSPPAHCKADLVRMVCVQAIETTDSLCAGHSPDSQRGGAAKLLKD